MEWCVWKKMWEIPTHDYLLELDISICCHVKLPKKAQLAPRLQDHQFATFGVRQVNDFYLGLLKHHSMGSWMLSGGGQNPGTHEKDQARDEAEAGVGRRQSESQRKALSSASSISSLRSTGWVYSEAQENRFLLIELEEEQGQGSRANRPRNSKTNDEN